MAKDYLSMASPSPSDAEHHGVKGMKWGVRKSEARAERLQRVVDGTASRRDKVIVGKTSRQRDIIKARGDLSKVAQQRLDRLQAHQDKKAAKADAKNADSNKPIPKAPANENSAQKYDRLRAQIKSHGPNSLEPDELNFVNARTEAIAKINKMNVSSPGWLTDTSKVVLQETTKTLMKDLAVKAGKEFIVKPLIKGK